MLSIKNLYISYKDNSIIENLNLEVKEGEILGILGKNGAGKTTLFNAIYQNIPYKGDIVFRNLNISRKNISFLETENYFYPYMTGEEYLSFFTEKKNIDVYKNLIQRFNLPLNKFIHNYSTGMKKKIALLGIILMNKPLIILDEPFNGMDFEGVELLYEIVPELKNNYKTIIITSHIIETLFNTCDKIALLDNKEISKLVNKENFHLL